MAERYISRFKKPTPYEREILTIMQEECAEIIVAISKALRFGINDGYPGGYEDNRGAISRELGDLKAVVQLAHQNGLIAEKITEAAVPEKLERLAKYMQHQPEDLQP